MRFRVIFIAFLLFLSILACSKKAPEPIDLGTFENGIYNCKYFGMTLDLSDGWNVQENQTMKMMADMGKKMIAGEDKNMEAMLDVSELTTVNLLLATKYPLGSSVPYNPNIAAVAEKVDQLTGIISGREYLQNVRKMLETSRLEVIFEDSMFTETLGGLDFDVARITMALGKISISQKYYATIKKGYALSLIVSYSSEEELDMIESLLGKLNFDL